MSNALRQSKLPFAPGVFPALVTPFDKDEEVDESAFRGLIRHVIDDVDGLAPCGTTGSSPICRWKSKSIQAYLRVAYSVLGLTQHAIRNTL